MRKRLFGTINIGSLIIIIGVLVAAPLLVLPAFPEEAHYWPAFAVPCIFSLTLGFFIWRVLRKDDDVTHIRMNIRTGSLTVLLAWIYGFIAGTVPFVISGQLGVLHGFFEAVSGWTTTGLSVMDVSVTPKIFLFHRSFMQFCGGLGFVMVVLLFVHGRQAMNLFSAEGHTDKLIPNLTKTAQVILLIYSGFVLLGMLLYRLFGMELFDSLLHSMCALSTGGFSTVLLSIGEYDSVAIEAVTMFLMLLGTTNFAVLLLLAKLKLRQVSRNSEMRFMFVLIVLVIPAVAWSFASEAGMGGLQALRHSAFNTISALSTTGYSTLDFADLPHFALGIFIMLMLIGGGMGSTAGGIKLSRVYILLRIMAYSLKRRVSPASQIESPHYVRAQGKVSIDPELITETTGFALTYIAVFIAGTLALTLADGCSLLEAGFEFASALGTVGLSAGVTSASSSAPALITLIIGMILGRLEIFIVFIGIYSGFKLSKEKMMMKRTNAKTNAKGSNSHDKSIYVKYT